MEDSEASVVVPKMMQKKLFLCYISHIWRQRSSLFTVQCINQRTETIFISSENYSACLACVSSMGL